MAPFNGGTVFLRNFDKQDISEAAKRFKIERSILSKHFHGKRGSIAKANEIKQILTNKQELVLVSHIQRLCDWFLPSTSSMVTTWTMELCGERPNKN
jgi:hypothetical protein